MAIQAHTNGFQAHLAQLNLRLFNLKKSIEWVRLASNFGCGLSFLRKQTGTQNSNNAASMHHIRPIRIFISR